MKKLFIVLLLVAIVVAEEISDEEQKTDNTGVVKPRKLKLGLGALGLAGFHALWVFWAIKLKILFVAFIVGVAIFFGIKHFAAGKLLGHGCPEIIHESPFTPYHSEHSDHEIYSSYPGPEPYSGHSSFGATGFSETLPPTQSASVSSIHDVTSAHPGFGRAARSKRQIESPQEFVDIGFRMLGVKTTPCRKRFVCEMEHKSKMHPISDMAFKFIAESFFNEYRTLDDSVQTIDDCERVYAECRMPDDGPYEDQGSQSILNNELVDDVTPNNSEKLGRVVLKRRRKNWAKKE